MKLKIRKHKWKTVKAIDGKVKRQLYTYTVSVRKWGLLWLDLQFYVCRKGRPCGRVDYIVNTEQEVLCRTCLSHKYATLFSEEADAIRVKLDIISHPDKYVSE
jgi:hypothetical protein